MLKISVKIPVLLVNLMKIAKVIMISALALVVTGAVFYVIAARKRPHLAPENERNDELIFDYWRGDMPWEETRSFYIPEYSGVEFKWTTDEVSANGETLFSGMPVWSVYLADLNGDGLREIASCASLGSGIIDERIYVYDYSSKQLYVLKNRMKSDFTLFMNNGEVWVRESKYASDDVISERKLALSEMECGSDF